ncbi:MAG: tRNA uridine(34) 5-carboxymethylaminomethyl modification radical SAM/GNAT enzyme Elp3 [Candidatus Bathyarchaeia archaeon]
MDASRAIIERLMEFPSPSKDDVNRVKIEVCGTLGVERIPGNAELIKALREGEERTKLLLILRRKKTRAASGIIVIATMTKPLPCPHGRCAYCPGGPKEGVPQSYTGHEPASMRGAQNLYDPYGQVESRVRQLRAIGHTVDKVELIIMGGTFPAAPEEYQGGFVKGCLEGLLGRRTRSLEEAKLLAERSNISNVGITVETRPDYARERQVDPLLEMGVTRVEIGVQNVYDDIYGLVERGHTVEDAVEATRVLRDSGLKVCYHMMPGLPGSNPDRDLRGFKRVFQDPDFRPDMLKIYPCLVIKGTKLYDWWKKGEYQPPSTEEAVGLLVKVKEMVPPWVRIMRIQRDIPAGLIEAGVKKSNLRQLVAQRLKEMGEQCRCIRCREAGHRLLKEDAEPDPDSLELTRRTYEASGGVEEFLSIEDKRRDILVALLRLRILSGKAHRPEIDPSRDSIVRELHVYGPMVPVGGRFPGAWQHRGWGSLLLSEAERLSREEYDRRKILVMSALGTKRYYMGLGYGLDGVYVSKEL